MIFPVTLDSKSLKSRNDTLLNNKFMCLIGFSVSDLKYLPISSK